MQDESVWQACLRNVIQQTFYQTYWRTFTLVQADNDALREQAFRLRYEVYVADSGGDHTGPRIERDIYDERAVHHLLMHNHSGEVAGTVRVLMPSVSTPLDSFEVQKYCAHPLLRNEERSQHLCEISRLCMAPRFRKRPGDGRALPAYTEQEWSADMVPMGQSAIRRRITFAPLGLMMAAFQTVMDRGLLDCVSMMDPADFRSFKRLGLPFKILGGKVEAMGVQQPVIFNILSALDGMERANAECWEIVSDKGRLNRRAHEIQLENWHHSLFEETSRPRFFGRFL